MAQDPVIRREVTVKLEEGLHLRPVSEITKLATRSQCDLKLIKGQESANAIHLLEMLSLNVHKDTVLIVEAQGSDAESVVDRVATILEASSYAELTGDV